MDEAADLDEGSRCSDAGIHAGCIGDEEVCARW